MLTKTAVLTDKALQAAVSDAALIDATKLALVKALREQGATGKITFMRGRKYISAQWVTTLVAHAADND